MKYCKKCGLIKKKHKIYCVQGEMYMTCEETKCEDGYSPENFISKEELKRQIGTPTMQEG